VGENEVAKGYIIANVEVTNPDQYAQYRPLSSVAVEAHGGTFIVRGGQSETLEGAFNSRTVVIEFPSFQAAQTFYHSAEYEAARHARAGAAQMNLMVVEGV
jgi:uncharacterized protein (DUF1330 family)